MSWGHQRPRCWLTVVALVLGLAGCGPAPAPLRIGVLVWPPYEVAFLAQDLGYLDERQIRLVDFASPANLVSAYRNGAVDVILVTADYLIDLSAKPTHQRVILVADISNGGDALLARPTIHSLEDLRGKRIAIEKSVLGAYMVRRALARAGLSSEDVQLVAADIPTHPDLYATGAVDAIVTYEPGRSAVIRQGAHELFSSRDIPGEIVDLVVTTQATIDARPRALQHFVDGWFKALAYLRDDPIDAARRVAHRESLTAEDFLHAIMLVHMPDRLENRLLLGDGDASLNNALNRHARVMTTMGLVEAPPDTAHLLDDRFVRQRP